MNSGKMPSHEYFLFVEVRVFKLGHKTAMILAMATIEQSAKNKYFLNYVIPVMYIL